MRTYATPDDLGNDWLDDVPGNAERLIRAASVMVEYATRMANYSVDDDGYPTASNIQNAFRDAVCQQVSAWHHANIDPSAGAAGQALYIENQTVDGGSVTYGGRVSVEERSKAITELDKTALMILRNAGLLSAHVVTR